MPLRASHRAVYTVTACTALALLGDNTLYAVLPASHDRIGLALWQVGWMLSFNRLARIPLNLPSGWLSDRYGPRTPFVVGVTLGCLSTLGYAVARPFWLLLALRALWGVAWALLVVAAYGLVLDVSAPEERGRMTGLYASGSFFGSAIGTMIGGFIMDALGFRPGMAILGACTALGVVGALTLPKTPRHAKGEQPVPAPRAPLGATLRALDARLWLIWGLSFAHRFFFAGIFYSTLGLYLRTALGDQVRLGAALIGVASLTATLMLVRNLVTVLVGPGLGYLSDRLGDRARVLALGEVLGVAALLVLSLQGSLWLVSLGVVLAAAAYGIVPPMLVSWMGDLTQPGTRGLVVGGYQTLGDVGSGLGPLLAYALVSWAG
ncbi:MAG: MFS transporter, partial [Chloroflexota bacterium]